MKLNVLAVNILLCTASAQGTVTESLKHYASTAQNKTITYLKPYTNQLQAYIKKHGLDAKAKKAHVVLLALSSVTLGMCTGMMWEAYRLKNKLKYEEGDPFLGQGFFDRSNNRTSIGECNHKIKLLLKFIFLPMIGTCAFGYTTYMTVASSSQNAPIKSKQRKSKR